MVHDADWRLQGQESFLARRSFERRPWTPFREGWDHDHCSFCWVTFGLEEVASTELSEGFVTVDDQYYWICPTCFEDFAERFEWTVRT